MKNFIQLTNAITNEQMIIKKSMICSVEETVINHKSARLITYIDSRPEEYVTNKLIDIFEELEKDI